MAKAARKKAGRSSAKKRTTKKTRSRGRTAARRNGGAGAGDAIALLKADHRQVEGWFEEFEKARSDDRKQELAQKICTALQVHAAIEEEIFYPAFLEATEDKEIHHEAEVEHAGAKHLISQIESAGPDDEYYDAKVSVLAEMIKHHVKEEEKRDGMFAKAKEADMDLRALGEQLQARKAELMADAQSGHSARTGVSRASGAAVAGAGGNRAQRDSSRRGVRM